MNNGKTNPPKLANRFLFWFLREGLAEEVAGDLEEQFAWKTKTSTVIKAKINYWYQVLNYLRPFAIQKIRSTHYNNSAMYKNYFKIGYRNLTKNKGYTFINIGGLAVGMTVAILIGLWINDELSYNKFHNNYDNIGQVLFHAEYNGHLETNRSVTTGLGTYIKNNYPTQFKHVVMVRARLEERLFSYEGNHFIEDGYFMQPEGPEMFGLQMIAGSINGLNSTTSVLLSRTLANKIFDDKDPIGEVVNFNDQADLVVKGVYRDLPKNSVFGDAAYLAPLDYFLYGWSDLNVWDNQNMYLFVQKRPKVNWLAASELIKDVYNSHLDPGREYNLFLHPMSEWHLNSNFEGGQLVPSRRVDIIWLYGVIGLAVLLLACVNFMNLSTARSENRAMEIGLRKSMGSQRFQLISQFLSESLLVSSLAFILTLASVVIILPWFNELSGKNMSVPWSLPIFWLFGIGFTLLTGLLAGSYPALFLSALHPIKSLKGTFTTGKNVALPRKILVVFQFTVSITLIIGTIIIYQQIQYAKDRPVGYMRDGLLMMPKRSSELYGNLEALRNELINTGVVEEIGEANYPLTNTLGNNGGFSWEGMAPENNLSFNTIRINQEYGKAIGWEVIMGRDFSRDNKTDNTAVIITESAREKMGLDNPIGMVLNSKYDYWGSPQFTIIGVINDLIKGDPFEVSYPAIMFLSSREMQWQFIRIKDGLRQGEAVAKIEEVYRELFPGAYTDFKIVQDEYAYKFKPEEKLTELATFFSIVAILISSLGLFGLASFMTEKRAKEIGIRKVLGATATNVWQLLTKEFITLVIVASIIATPIAFYSLNNWINNYEYRMEISSWVFVYAALVTMIITLVTVSYQALKAAYLNPVESLKEE